MLATLTKKMEKESTNFPANFYHSLCMNSWLDYTRKYLFPVWKLLWQLGMKVKFTQSWDTYDAAFDGIDKVRIRKVFLDPLVVSDEDDQARNHNQDCHRSKAHHHKCSPSSCQKNWNQLIWNKPRESRIKVVTAVLSKEAQRVWIARLQLPNTKELFDTDFHSETFQQGQLFTFDENDTNLTRSHMST